MPSVINPPPGNGSGDMVAANNLSDLASAANAVANLGLDSRDVTLGNDLIRRTVSSVISNGATTDRGRILTPGAIGAVAGLPITIEAEFVVPTSAPSTYANVAIVSDSTSAGDLSDDTRTNTMWVQIKTALRIKITGAASSSYRIFSDASFRADYSGQAVKMAVVFTEGDSTTDPTITVNGVDVSSNFSLTTNGTIPNWMDASLLADTYFIDGYNWPSGDASTARVVIGAYSDAEAVTWTAGGQRPAWAERAGSVTDSLISGRNGSFETDTASPPALWLDTGNQVATAVADGTAPDGSNVMEIVASGTGSWTANAVYNNSSSQRVPGQGYMVTFWAQSISGSTDLRVRANFTKNFTIDGTWRLYCSDQVVPTSTGTMTAAFYLNAAGTVRIDDVRMISLGLIDNPHPQPGRTSFDSLGRMSRRNVGHVNVTDRDTFTIYANTSTSGNEQALGGALFESANNVTIDLIEQATATGTPTTTIGSASGGAQYKASGALSAGLNVLTPVTRKPASTSVWVGSDDTTNVRTIIHGHKVSVPVS